MSEGLTPAEIKDAMNRMPPEDKAFFQRLLKEGEPKEALVFLEIHHYFPGAHIVDEDVLRGH